jgi:Zn-finger protein
VFISNSYLDEEVPQAEFRRALAEDYEDIKINKEKELKNLETEEFPCCFEGFLRHNFLFCWCISSILISLAIGTVISIA